MSAIIGSDGSINTGSAVVDVKKFALDITMETPDGTVMGTDGWRQKVEGIKDWKGNFACQVRNIAVGAVPSATFKTKTSGGNTVVGPIMIAKEGIECVVDGVVMWSYDFEGNGKPTIT